MGKRLKHLSANRARWFAHGLGAVVAIVLVGAPYTHLRLSLLFYLLMWVTLASGINIMVGYAGYVNFGYVVFFGVGAVTAGLFVALGISPYMGLLSGGLAALAMSVVIGYPTLRGLRGAYYAIATLGVSEAVRIVLMDVFPFGVCLPPGVYTAVGSYYCMLALAAGVVLLGRYLATSSLGLALKAIREDEDAAEVRGVDTFRYKMLANALSAVPAGIAGGIEAWYTTYVDIRGSFLAEKSVTALAMTMLGGSGTAVGPAVGSSLLYLVEDALWSRIPFVHLVLYGAIIVGVVLLMPRGLVGTLSRGARWRTRRRRAE